MAVRNYWGLKSETKAQVCLLLNEHCWKWFCSSCAVLIQEQTSPLQSSGRRAVGWMLFWCWKRNKWQQDQEKKMHSQEQTLQVLPRSVTLFLNTWTPAIPSRWHISAHIFLKLHLTLDGSIKGCISLGKKLERNHKGKATIQADIWGQKHELQGKTRL